MALIKDKILVIEDEKSISYLLGTVLTANGYDVIKAYTGTEACEMLDAYCPDLILLDLGLPDMDGVDIIRRVRSRGTAPIVVVSARTRERDKIEALDLGADDYITKPFNILEVKARIKAIMRRTGKKEKDGKDAKVIVKGDLKLDCESRRVFSKDREINLTAKEFDLLELLAHNPNKVYSREDLLNLVWGYEYPGDARTVDVHIRRLREKIEVNPSDPKYVYTKWGVGYYFRG